MSRVITAGGAEGAGERKMSSCIYRKSSIIPTREAYLFQTHLRGGGGLFFRVKGLFNLGKTMISVLYKELEDKVEKLKYKKLEVMQPRSKRNSNFQLVNTSSPISPLEVLQS